MNLRRTFALLITASLSVIAMAYVSAATELTVDPTDALCDQQTQIRVEGIKPEELIRIATICVSSDGSRWQANALFKADEAGTVNVARDKPIDGTYKDVDQEGLFWSMRPAVGVDAAFSPPHELAPLRIDIAVSDKNGKEVSRKTIVRRQVAESVVQREVKEGSLVGALFYPKGDNKSPAILLLGGSEGGFERDALPAMLASRGFAVFSLAYFGVTPLPENLVQVPIETVERGLEFLGKQPFIADARQIAVIGTSRGGELALLSATMYPQIKAVVALVPTTIVFAGLEFGRGPVDQSPWTHNGNPLPYVTYQSWSKFLATNDAALVEAATIPVEKITGPIMFIAGDEDRLGLSGIMSKMAIRRLTERKHNYPDRNLNYRDAGHLILLPPFFPMENTTRLKTPYGELDFGGSAGGNAHAVADSWPQILSFLRRTLSAN